MLYTIENDDLKVIVSSDGAEMQSIIVKQSGREALWQANVEGYWNRHAPVLFPYCGCLPNNKFTHNGKEYTSGQHGFLRDMAFSLVSQKGDEIILACTDNAETLTKYPFHFYAEIKYIVVGNVLHHFVKVKNTSDEKMYFNIGYHPAFSCPFDEKHIASDYTIKFEQKETPTEFIYNPETGFNTGEMRTVFENSDELPVTEKTFDDDSIAINNLKSGWVSIVENDSQRCVKLNIKDFEFVVFWSCLAKPMRFLCIEPWHGINAMAGADSEISKKFAVQSLDAGKEYETDLEMTFK